MAENRKGNEGLYYVSKTQLVVVAGGFTLTCALVFLFGILIGQGIEERKLLKQEEPLVKIPLQPLTPGSKQGSSGKDELTFYDTLSKTPSQPKTEPAKEPKAAAEKTAKTEAKQVKEAKPEQKPPQEIKPAAKEVKTVTASASKEPPPAAPKAKEKSPAEIAAVETKKSAPAKPAEEDKSKTVTSPKEWTVQVNASPDEKSQKQLVERLKQKGYDAYIVTTNQSSRDWYRVRVGHFAERSQAQEMLEVLQTKENFKGIIVGR